MFSWKCTAINIFSHSPILGKEWFNYHRKYLFKHAEKKNEIKKEKKIAKYILFHDRIIIAVSSNKCQLFLYSWAVKLSRFLLIVTILSWFAYILYAPLNYWMHLSQSNACLSWKHSCKFTCNCVNPTILSVINLSHWLSIAKSSQWITPLDTPFKPRTSNAFVRSLSVP